MSLDRGAERLLRMLAAMRASGGASGPQARRAGLERLAEIADAAPDAPVRSLELSIPGPAGPIGARRYRPGTAIAGGMIYFHGGGWVAGGLATHDNVCRRLASASGLTVLAVDYRLAPEHPFPAALEDALAATRWASERAMALELDPARLVVAGDSAGAALAAAVAQHAAAPPIALQLLICPILDLAGRTASRHQFAEGYFLDMATFAADVADYAGARADLEDPRLSPLRAGRLDGLAPALIHTAAFDPFRDEGEAYATRLAAAGVATRLTRHAGMIHYFYALARAIPYAAEALAAIGAETAAALGEAA